MQEETAKKNYLPNKSRSKKLAMLIPAMVLILIVIYYLNSKSKDHDKIESQQSSSKSADSILIEKLSNTDTITSLQDPIDTLRINPSK